MTLVLIAILLVTSGVQIQPPKEKPCTKEDAINAETEASSLHSWTEVYESYERYHQCDDGAIGEGYSNSVAQLLSGKWASIGELNQLVSRDKKFERFVLNHVDELMTATQATRIRENASAHCPPSAKRLCKSIETQVENFSPPARP